ncbi:MAG TPA: MBL fold metallo-hydrolase [Bacteroidia bacterium]|nr:MBL fold metallo-hydrolase [Bacteroidia bacterium]
MKEETTIHYDRELTLVLGGGGNSGILTSDSLVMVIDTKMGDAAKHLYELVKKLAGDKPVLVINTHIHPDHTEGNKFYAGARIMAGGNYSPGVWIKEAGKEGMPTEWVTDKTSFMVGNEKITVMNLGRNVHTESDVIVYFHGRKLLFGGDVILNKQNAIIIGKGDPYGYLWAFDKISSEFEIEHIVPGHGYFGSEKILSDFYTYFKDMKLAAEDPTLKDTLIAKYQNWNCLPFFMSPEATIRSFKKSMKQ